MPGNNGLRYLTDPIHIRKRTSSILLNNDCQGELTALVVDLILTPGVSTFVQTDEEISTILVAFQLGRIDFFHQLNHPLAQQKSLLRKNIQPDRERLNDVLFNFGFTSRKEAAFNTLSSRNKSKTVLAVFDMIPPSDTSPERPDAGSPGTTEAAISVNHPLRYRGMTLYQADWSLATISLQLGRSPVLELPLQTFPQLGDQIWGLVLPTRPDGTDPVLLSLTSEQGPVQVFGPDGVALAQLVPGGEAREVKGLPIRVAGVLPASGILLKRDPGVPLVYAGFAVALLGGALSLVATRQLWAIADPASGRLHVAGLCNRNLTAFAGELPALLQRLEPSPAEVPQA